MDRAVCRNSDNLKHVVIVSNINSPILTMTEWERGAKRIAILEELLHRERKRHLEQDIGISTEYESARVRAEMRKRVRTEMDTCVILDNLYKPLLSETKVLPSDGETCIICTELLSNGTQIDDSSCTTEGHAFHKFCLDTWRKNAPTCPLCKSDLL